MNKRITPFALAFLISLISSFINAQTNPTATDSLLQFAKNAHAFHQIYPQEKVYLHCDNSSYFQSETIWFKAYVVRASDSHFTTDSKILYVELLTEDGREIDTRKLKIENGQCHGEFDINVEAKAGYYELRAYTRAMLNFGDECIFSRVIPIYNRPLLDGDYAEKDMEKAFDHGTEKLRRPAEEEKNKRPKQININFYPEGGSLVKGIKSKVAFKASGKDGEHLNITGRVLNIQGKTIAQFASKHQAMGYFDITPQDDIYTVEVSCGNKTQSFDLPVDLRSGYTLSIDNKETNNIEASIRKTPDQTIESLGLAISCRNKLSQFSILKVEGDELQLLIDKTKLPIGVHTATLFRASGEILAERLFYVNHSNDISLTSTGTSKSYKPLQKITLGLTAIDTTEAPLKASLSVSIKDASSSGQSPYNEDIRTHLLLSSDLKGYIHQPGYYFARNDDNHQEALDLLMMTQGWRRYKWELMSGIKPFEVKHHIEESLMIKGQVLKAMKDKPMRDVRLKYRLSKEGEKPIIAYANVDNNGEFAFLLDDSLDIHDRWDLSLSTPKKGIRSQRNRILIDRQFAPNPKLFSYYESTDYDTIAKYNSTSKETLEPSIGEIQLMKEYRITRQKSRLEQPTLVYNIDKETNDLSDLGIYYGRRINSYLDDKHTLKHLTDSNLSYYLFNSYNNSYPSNVYVPDITTTSIDKVEIYTNHNSIEYLSNILDQAPEIAFNTNSTKSMAIVVVYTKDDKAYHYVLKGTRLTYLNGYSNSKEFAKVVLHNPIIGEIDHRRTLYWNPNVKLDDEGKAKFEFYNNSSCEHILIDAQGITSDGVPVSFEKH